MACWPAGCLAALIIGLALCGTASAATNLWPDSAPACDALNGETYTATGSNKYLKIGYIGLMQGSWAKYSQGYCQILTMWKDFFFENGHNGLVLDDGTKVGLMFFMKDATVFQAGSSTAYDANPTNAQLTVLGKEAVNTNNVNVLLSNYGSGYTPYVAKAGEDLGRVVLGPGAAAESVYVCPATCTNEAECQSAAFGCTMASSRRFKYLFGSFSPAGYYFRNFVSLSVMKRAKTVAFFSEHTKSFTAAMRDGARTTAEDLGLKVVADIGIKYVTCLDTTSETCTKPTKNQLTDLIPAGGIQKILDDGKPIEHNLETYLGAGYKDLADPFAELAKALDVDVVIGATYYDSCVALVKAFSELKFYPKSLAVAACVGNPNLYDAVGKDLRWLSGPTQWVNSLSGPDYIETALLNVKHYIKDSSSDDPSPLQFYNAFLAKWGSGPSYQIASCMAGLYHLEGAVKIAGVDDHVALLTAMNDFSSPSFFGQIAVDKFGRNTVRSSIIIDYDDKATANVVAPLFAAKTEHVYPIPAASSNLRNMQCAAGMQVEGSNNFCLSGSGPASTHGTVGNFCGTECVSCPASTHSSEAGSLNCTTCPLNTFTVATNTVTCSKCLNGQSTDGKTGATTCAACASGFFNDVSGNDCRPCQAGTFSLHKIGDAQGASACVKCKDMPGNFYQPQAAQPLCLECPTNTENSGSTGTALLDCICKPGFWRPDGQTGTECYPCPLGAECTGGVQGTQPFTQDGYWAPFHANGTIHGFPFVTSNNTALPQTFFRCPNIESCKANNTCDNEHEGNMCRQCTSELHNMLGFCIGCPGGGLLTLIEWIIVVLLWQSVQYLSKVYPTLDMLLLYAQCLSIIQGFNVPWPKDLYELTMVMSIVNFNIDAVTPACAGISWNYYKSFWFTIFLPVMFGIGHLAWVGLGYAWMKLVARRTAFGGKLALSCFITDAQEFRQYWMKSLSNWIALLVILYNALCVTVLQAFVCDDMPNGEKVLRIDPDQPCGTGDHIVVMAFAVLAIIVYVFGIPIALFLTLSQKRKQNKLKDDESLTLLGFVYTDYEPGFWFWEMIITARRFILCVLMVLLYAMPQFQLACGLILTIAFICIQYFWRPFKQGMLDVLDSAALVSMALYMIAGLIFTSENSTPAVITLTTQIILISTTIFIVFAICLFFLTIIKDGHGGRNQKLLRNYTVGAWVKATAALRLNIASDADFYALIGGEGQSSVSVSNLADCAAAVGLDSVLGKDVIGHLLFLLLDRDRSGIVPSRQALENLYKGFEVNTPAEVKLLNDTINSKYFRGAFPTEYDIQCHATSTEQSDSFVLRIINERAFKPEWLDEMLRREKHVIDKGCALNNLLSENKLSAWLQSLLKWQDIEMIMVVSLVNQWLSPFFTESADFGLNSYTEECQFYQDMGFGCPFLIDMLLSATNAEQAKCQVNISDWFISNQAQRKAHRGIVLSDEIEYFCRPQLLHWLVNHSDEVQRKIFQRMLFNIIEHEHKSISWFSMGTKVVPETNLVSVLPN